MKAMYMLLAFFIVTVSPFLASTYSLAVNNKIIVTHAWVRLMPHSSTTTTAYMVIENHTDKEAILESASSDMAQITQIRDVNKMMQHMGLASKLYIPSQDKIALLPGGFYIMLINLKKPLNKGDKVALTLNFQGEKSIKVNADVREQVFDSNYSMPMLHEQMCSTSK